jgi:hypothetical protein
MSVAWGANGNAPTHLVIGLLGYHWVPGSKSEINGPGGHNDIEGNERAAGLAKAGTFLPEGTYAIHNT